MKYLLLSLLVLSTATMAADKAERTTNTRAKIAEPSSKTLDLETKGKTEDVTEDKALVMKPSDVKMDVTCKEKNGHELKHGDKGYEACLEQMKKDKKNPHAPNADVKVDFKKD